VPYEYPVIPQLFSDIVFKVNFNFNVNINYFLYISVYIINKKI
jgi:hypothetical protein